MTASRALRRRSAVIGAVVAVSGLVVAAVLGWYGADSLFDSTSGDEVSAGTVAPSMHFATTPTAVVGVTDADDRLTSVAVLALDPDGTGGSIIAMSASADVGAGVSPQLRPLSGVLAQAGPEGFVFGIETLTTTSFDLVELMGSQRFGEMIAPLGDLDVSFGDAIADEGSGMSWGPGAETLSPEDAGRLLAAADDSRPDAELDAARARVWEQVAAGAGDGLDLVESAADDEQPTPPSSLDEFVARLLSGEVRFRALSAEQLGAADLKQLDPQLDGVLGEDVPPSVVVHPRAEMLMMMSAVAPGRLSAPFEGPTFRVVSHFDNDELAASGLARTRIMKQAIDVLLFGKGNVVSVGFLTGREPPQKTEFRVATPGLSERVESDFGGAFGDVIIAPAETPIEGVDVEIVLGDTFLEEINE